MRKLTPDHWTKIAVFLLAISLTACVSGPEPEQLARANPLQQGQSYLSSSSVPSRLQHLPQKLNPFHRELPGPKFEQPSDYTQFEKTVSESTGPLNVLSEDDPLLEAARTRGLRWPMVANRGSSAVYPRQHGLVSFYHEQQILANGADYNPHALTAAHKSLPFGTLIRCTRLDSGRSVVVMINDRGPYVRGRVLDLSHAAARELGMIRDGVTRCAIEVLAYPLIEVMGPRGNG